MIAYDMLHKLMGIGFGKIAVAQIKTHAAAVRLN